MWWAPRAVWGMSAVGALPALALFAPWRAAHQATALVGWVVPVRTLAMEERLFALAMLLGVPLVLAVVALVAGATRRALPDIALGGAGLLAAGVGLFALASGGGAQALPQVVLTAVEGLGSMLALFAAGCRLGLGQRGSGGAVGFGVCVLELTGAFSSAMSDGFGLLKIHLVAVLLVASGLALLLGALPLHAWIDAAWERATLPSENPS